MFQPKSFGNQILVFSMDLVLLRVEPSNKWLWNKLARRRVCIQKAQMPPRDR